MRQLLWGLAGAVTAVATYVVMAYVLFTLTLSLDAMMTLFIYLPVAFLVIGVLGAVISALRMRPTATAGRAGLAFWCGWALCPVLCFAFALTQ